MKYLLILVFIHTGGGSIHTQKVGVYPSVYECQKAVAEVKTQPTNHYDRVEGYCVPVSNP